MRSVACGGHSEESQSCELPLHDSAALLPARCSYVFGSTVPPDGSDPLDIVFLLEMPIRQIGVICLVADQPRRQFVERIQREHFNESTPVRRGRAETNSHGNADSCGDGHDLCPFALRGFSDRQVVLLPP